MHGTRATDDIVPSSGTALIAKLHTFLTYSIRFNTVDDDVIQNAYENLATVLWDLQYNSWSVHTFFSAT